MNTTEGKTQDNHKKAKTAAEQTQKKTVLGFGAESQAGSWDYSREKNKNKSAPGFILQE